MKNQILFCLFAAVYMLFGFGCATKNEIYYWGEYEEVIYQSYKNPGEMPTERQIEILEADIQKAKAKNISMPPGWHAHLGLLYYDVGNMRAATRQFRTEKKKFPESQVLMDFFGKSQKGKVKTK